jgi:hypothetical protein
MSTLSAASLRHKPNITGRSTGSCPSDWRRFWATESERAGSNWRHLLDAAPTWRESAEQYHRDRAGHRLVVEIGPEHLKRLRRLMRPGVTLEQAYREVNDPRNRPTPNVVVEAIMLAVRTRGLAALKEPATVERLERCDVSARAEINQRIEKLGLKP